MFSVKTFNNIAPEGIAVFDKKDYSVGPEQAGPDAILLRSHKLQEAEIDASVKAIGRAGAGVNNVPVDSCTARGIPVFNAPGANANAVKELVICGLLLSSRGIIQGHSFTQSLCDIVSEELTDLVETNKKNFNGKKR